MNIGLIGINSKYIHPSMGLYQIKANCKYPLTLKEFTIKDNPFDIINYIEANNFDLIGISCYIWNIEFIKTILNYHFNDKPIIVLGGFEASFNYKKLFEYSNVDYIAKGEGEDTFNELIDFLLHKKNINEVSNLYYKENNTILFTFNKLPDLNKIKHDYSLIKDFEHQICYVESSRGCYFNCSYCLASTEKPVRFFPITEVKENILFLLNKKAKIIKFLDRSFNIDSKRMLEILKFINENDNGISTFQFEVVGDMLTDEVIEYIKTMRKKFIRFEIGVQSTNDLTMQSIYRRQDFSKLRSNVLSIKDYIVIHTDLIAGLPFETKERFKQSFNETFMLLTEELQLGFLKELKGTRISNEKDMFHYIFSEVAPYEVIENDFITYPELQEIKLVEASVDKLYNPGNFKRTFSYLFKDLNLNPYEVFKEITLYITKFSPFNKLQYDELTKLFYESLIPFVTDKDKLFYYIKLDYLTKNQIKPKIWWDNYIDKDEKKFIFDLFLYKYPNDINHELIYRYSKLEKINNEYTLILYKPSLKIFTIKTNFTNSYSYCGFDCSLCLLYKKEFGCNGCRSDKDIYSFCKECDIRGCAKNRKHYFCGECGNFPCDKCLKLSKQSIEFLNNIRKEK